MRLWKSWTVAMKDFDVFRKKRYVIYSLVALPVILSLLMPGSILFAVRGKEIPVPQLEVLMSSEMTLFIMLAALLPSVIASYSFIGEKVQKSLEPLLATPTTDAELLMGKGLAAFLPSVGATYAGAIIFMVFVDAMTYGQVGGLLFPDWNAAVILLVAVPLVCVLSVEFNVVVSSRVNDVRAAQQLGSLVVLPLVAIFVLGESGAVSIDPFTLLEISAAILVADVALFFVSKATFQREEILTKWR